MRKLISFVAGLILAASGAAAQTPGSVWTYQGPTLPPQFLPVTGAGLGNMTASGSFVVGNLYKANSLDGFSAIDSGIATANVVTLAGTQTLTNKTLNCANNTCTVRLGSDVSGNLPVANLNSGTSASSSTFWRGDGTWATPAGGGSGTVSSGTVNQLAYYTGSTTVSSIGSAGTTTTLLHGNASGTPSFSAVSLSADVTGNLPVGNLNSGTSASSSTFWRGDGTWATPAGAGTVTSVNASVPGSSILGVTGGPITGSGTLAFTTTGTSGGMPYFSSGSVLSSSALLAQNQIIVGGGAGLAPTTIGSLGTTTTVLHGNAAGGPSFSAVSLANDVTGNMAVSHLNSGTSASSSTFWRGDGTWATPAGSGTVTSVGLAPGFAVTVGTRNTGSDAITTTGTINSQLFTVTKTSNYTVNADSGGTSDSGALLVATAGGVTFTNPNPASGTKGISYQFGSDGTNNYTLGTVGGTATFYGCPGGGGTTLVQPSNVDTIVTDDGTNYKCTSVSAAVIPVALTWIPGINPNNLPVANINQNRIIVGIRCNPEVASGGTSVIQPVKAASATAISAGTNLTSTTCNANGTAATDQTLTVSSSTLAPGDRIGIQTTGTTIWTSSGVATGVITFFLR